MIIASASQFHIFQEKALLGALVGRGLLHDCEIFAYLRIIFVSRWCWCGALLSGDIGGVTVENWGPLLASAGSWSPVWPGAGLPVTPPSVAHQLLSGPLVTYTYIYQLFLFKSSLISIEKHVNNSFNTVTIHALTILFAVSLFKISVDDIVE